MIVKFVRVGRVGTTLGEPPSKFSESVTLSPTVAVSGSKAAVKRAAEAFGSNPEPANRNATKNNNLPSEFVLVPRPSSSCSIFWRRDGFEDEDEGREHLAEERFMESEERVWAVSGRQGACVLIATSNFAS